MSQEGSGIMPLNLSKEKTSLPVTAIKTKPKKDHFVCPICEKVENSVGRRSQFSVRGNVRRGSTEAVLDYRRSLLNHMQVK